MAVANPFVRLSLTVMVAVWLAAGCETKIEDEGPVTLAELQGIQPEPEQPAAETETTEPETPTVIAGGAGIGPQGEGGGFIWKPVGEHTGRLVVILPPQYTGHASSAYIASASGSPIEGGAYTGVANGGRMHFRFSKPGSGYGRNILVVANLKAGGAVHWPIPNGAARTTY